MKHIVTLCKLDFKDTEVKGEYTWDILYWNKKTKIKRTNIEYETIF